jgi:hypothetical protein
MKRINFLSAFLLFAVSAQAQTRLIALKSHSGSSSNYHMESFGNFGMINLPRYTLEKVEKLNDSTVIMTNRTDDGYMLDTVMHHPQFSGPDVREEDLRELYDNKVEFKNFSGPGHPKSDSLYPQKTPVRSEPDKTNPPEPLSPGEDPADPGHKKNSLLLLMIGGGTFFGGGIIASVRRRKNVPKYA